jgi:SAM-dependent methyltransferase
MPNPSRNFYSRAPVQALFARELAALAPILSGVYGNYGLLLRAHEQTRAEMPAHLLGRMLELALDQDRLNGSVQCEPGLLPFASETFKLVVAQHVFEQLTVPELCVAEIARVLAPEGVALVLGFNPAGSWRPWLALNAQRGGACLHLQSAHFWQQRLARQQVDTLQIRFPGTLWPAHAERRGDQQSAGANALARFGSSWLILARKRRSVLTPLRVRSSSRELALNPRLAPGAQRACG